MWAAGAVAYALKKAAEGEGSRGLALAHDFLETAPNTLLPLVDHAAEAAGRWVAENSPELIRDRLLPLFIGSFTDATRG